jgi:hypothetical protein
MHEALIAVLPIVSFVLGTVLQHFLARSKEREGQFRALGHAAYADYLRGVATMAIQPTAEARAQVADAKARIAVYGSNRVIEQLAALEISGANLSNERSIVIFVSMVEEMRGDGKSQKRRLPNEALKTILFGARPA